MKQDKSLENNEVTDKFDMTKITENITKTKNNKKKIVILIIFVVLIIISFLIKIFLLPYMKYKSAEKLQNSEQYVKAISIYITLEGYKDSVMRIKECNYQEILLNIKNKNYKNAINLLNGTRDYKDSNELYKEIKYLQAKQFIEEYNYKDAILNFEVLNDYKDSKALLIEAKYQKAISLYNIDNFSDSKGIFKGLNSYKESNNYLSKIDILEKIYGIKQIGYSDDIIEISKNSCELYKIDYDRRVVKTSYKVTIEGDILKISDKYTIYLKDNYPYINGVSGEKRLYIAHEIPYYPKVGMSASQVEKSTWDSPNRINKTTNTYGVSEQWVYSGNRYIYLDDGVVTSIQD